MSAQPVAEHFQDARQQREAAQLGLWLFLATEILLFGGLFMGLLVYRVTYPDVAAEASGHLRLWLGGANTGVLLTSSLCMALAVVAARAGAARRCAWLLLATAALGVVFLGVKGYEYWVEYQEGLIPGAGKPFPLEAPPAELFFNLYFAATSLHALHLSLGVAAVLALAWSVRRARVPLPAYAVRVEGVGLYWHLVDLVWVFLYPTMYLV